MCDAVWEKGMAAPDRTKYPVWMKPSKQCTFDLNGKRVYVAPKDEESLRAYLESKRVVKDVQKAKDGVYTWVLYRTGKDSELEFAASRVKSVLETGTLHRAIVYRSKAKTVHGAGEFQKEGKKISINVQSGSFMAEWKLPESCALKDMGAIVLERVKPFLEGMEVSTEHTDSFITDAMVPDKKEIDSYKKKGLIICDYEEEGACKKDKGKKCVTKGGKTRRRLGRRLTRRW